MQPTIAKTTGWDSLSNCQLGQDIFLNKSKYVVVFKLEIEWLIINTMYW